MAAQNDFLDGLESRRWSISSTASTLTELSSRCSEDFECVTNVSPIQIHAPSIAANTARVLGETCGDVVEVVVGVMAPVLRPSLEMARDERYLSGEAQSNPGKEVKKAKRRQKKKMAAGSAKADQELGHGHQLKRMREFMASKSQEKSKKTRMHGKLSRQALVRTVTVPYELGRLKTTRGIQHQTRVYRHEELESLGVRTISWDGQSVELCSRVNGTDVSTVSAKPCQ